MVCYFVFSRLPYRTYEPYLEELLEGVEVFPSTFRLVVVGQRYRIVQVCEVVRIKVECLRRGIVSGGPQIVSKQNSPSSLTTTAVCTELGTSPV